jgi:hypothetical protein
MTPLGPRRSEEKGFHNPYLNVRSGQVPKLGRTRLVRALSSLTAQLGFREPHFP